MPRTALKTCTAWIAAAALLAPVAAPVAASAQTVTSAPTTAAAGFSPAISAVYRDPANEPTLSQEQLAALVRQHVKYVFVLFQENRSFDHYFGTFPGANGLFADASATPVLRATPTASGTQAIYDTDGSLKTISSFRIGTAENAADLDDVDHGHPRMAAKMNLPNGTGTPLMDRFALNEELKYVAGTPVIYGKDTVPTIAPGKVTLRAKQFGELAMAYVDCDTVPFMWNWANRFVLFDNIFQTTIGPSTPNAIAMISGQSGDTQWVRHADEAIKFSAASNAFTNSGVPVVNDPLPGLPSDTAEYSGKPNEPSNTVPVANTGAAAGAPLRKNENGAAANVAPNLTFASLPLTLAGRTVKAVASGDTNPAQDLVDVPEDLAAIMERNTPDVAWGWYQNGYDAEPNLPTANGIASTPHASYIGHHNGPQYFGYVTNNPALSAHQHGLGDFFADIDARKLPEAGGVFYIRGGYDNIAGIVPDTSHAGGHDTVTAAADAAYITNNFLGDDDHPGYSDSQISEALLAREINAIAASPYWASSAIIVTYDESEGDYDHVPPRILSFDPAGLPLSRGPRIPLLLVSPFARAHVVSHEEGDHNSVIGLINTAFGLNPLADLPDEAKARRDGEAPAFATAGVKQTNLGPHDGVANPTAGTGFLLTGFDPARLQGTAPPLPASYATTDPATLDALPHLAGAGCSALGIVPLDRQFNVPDTAPPADFFARPGLTPN